MLVAETSATEIRYSTQALTLFTAMTTKPSPGRKQLIDTCITALVDGTVWSKLDALYVFAAPNAQAALLNWVNPGTFDCTAVNSPTFTADKGYTGDGVSMSLSTGFNPSTAGGLYQQFDATLFTWENNPQKINGAIAGYPISAEVYYYARFTDDLIYVRIQDTAGTSFASSNGQGLLSGSRRANNEAEFYKNGVSLGTNVTLTTEALINEILMFLNGDTKFHPGQIVCGGFGSKLTDAEQLALYNALRAYLHPVAGVA